jgi:hypothetical protein
MAVGLPNFNRIIDVSFITATESKYDSRGFSLNGIADQRSIVCARHGRKPDIEITGTFTTTDYLPVFNISIKNLYLELQKEQYAKIKVRCGYEGNLITIEGTILSIFQESPGPEGRTVIQCQLGNLKDWLESTVDLNFDKGTAITDVLDAIKGKLNVKQTHYGSQARALNLKEKFMHNGSAREAMAKLSKMFEEERLAVFMRTDMLVAICLSTGDRVGEEILQYMSAPPQPNTGDEAGTYYTTITAPWMPKLQVGDVLIIPSRVYMRNYGIAGTGKTQKIQVTNINFHFGTTGSTNSMTVQGFMVR